jgi:hypothetical protein
MVLVDLGDPTSEPWVIDEANIGGIGASWGPTGLVAAEGYSQQDSGLSGAEGSGRQDIVVVDPEAHATRHVSMQGRGLIGGGPSIIWAADGSGIIGSRELGSYEVVPLDDSVPVSGVTEVFPHGDYGAGLAVLRICSAGMNCPGGPDGRVERVEADGSAATIWRPDGTDRALAASFALNDDGYWLTMDHGLGREVVLLRVRDGRQDTVATINRDARWLSVAFAGERSDQSGVVAWIDLGGSPAAVTVPLTGGPQSLHRGGFAGFAPGSAVSVLAGGRYETPSETMPGVGETFALPTLDALIAAELALNPGRTVLGKGSRDGVQGDSGVRRFEVTRDVIGDGDGDVYLDCLGPSNVTVRSGENSVTSPCLTAGSYIGASAATGPIIVEASGDTSWRVVVYSR